MKKDNLDVTGADAVANAMAKRAGRKPSEDATIERLTDLLVFTSAVVVAEIISVDLTDAQDEALMEHIEEAERLFRRYYDSMEAGVDKFITPLLDLPGLTRFKMDIERVLRTPDRSNPRHFCSNVMPLVAQLQMHPVKFKEVFTGRTAKAMRQLVQAAWMEDGDAKTPQTLATLSKIPSVSAAPVLREWTKKATVTAGVSLASGDVEIAVADAETAGNIGEQIAKVDAKLEATAPMTQEAADLEMEKVELHASLAEAVEASHEPALSMASAVQSMKADATPDYLRNLDDEKVAYIYAGGKTLLNAGAGAGKTKAITCKVKYLVDEKGLQPDQIVVCSFTKAASAEIADRVDKSFGIKGKYIGRTSNSFAYGIISMYRPDLKTALANGQKADALARYAYKQLTLKGTEHYTSNRANSPYATRAIAMDDPRMSWVHLGQDPIDENGKPIRLRQLMLTISKWKNDLYKPDEAQREHGRSPAKGDYGRAAASFYAAYEWLKRRDPNMSPCLDFDDQHIVAYETLRDNESVRERVQGQFRAVIIDEAQDYNNLQFKLFHLLSGKAEYVDYVGDDRQAIYGFRGALPEEFQALAGKGFQVLNMQTNYRSGSSIVNAGEQLIAYNKDQLPKVCRAEISRGEGQIRYATTPTHQEAALSIAMEVKAAMDAGAADPSAFGVVVRNNAEKDAVMLSLISRGIPYRSNSDTDYFNNPSVRSLLAWVSVATLTDPSEVKERTEALKVALKFPAYPDFKLPYQYIEKLERSVRTADLVEAIMSDRYADANVQNLQAGIRKLEALAMQADTGLLVQNILEMQGASGSMLESLADAVDVDKMIEEGLEPDQITKDMLVDRVLATFQPIRDLAAVREVPRNFVDVLKKLKAANQKCKKGSKAEGNVEPAVQIDTCHQWKGLEADHVFVIMSKGVWPSAMNGNDPKAIAEERRLAYVAITRGRDSVKVLCPEMSYNGKSTQGISPFVSEACLRPESEKVKTSSRRKKKATHVAIDMIKSLEVIG